MKYSIDDKNALWRILDGEAVIVNTKNSYYYSLNKTGAYIWKLLVNKAMGQDEIAKALSCHYQKDKNEIAGDVVSILGGLLKEGLIRKE